MPDPLLGQLVAESMTGFIFVVDSHGTVEFVSDSSTENVGHSPMQIQGLYRGCVFINIWLDGIDFKS